MGDPYRIYFTNTDRDNVSGPSFPGYLSSETPSLLFNPTLPSTEPPHSYASDLLQRDLKSLTTTEPPRSYASDLLQRDIKPLTTGVYAADDTVDMRFRPEPALGGTAGAGIKDYPSLLEVPSLVSQRQDVGAVSVGPSVPTGISKERPLSSLINGDGIPAVKGESNVLFIDGLPTDCTRREVGHLFRPFIGFKELKLVHKEPRRSGDKAMVLCFVEFIDPKCALTAMEALQGYKFDDKKPDSPALKIQYAHFPFRHPAGSREPRIGIPR